MLFARYQCCHSLSGNVKTEKMHLKMHLVLRYHESMMLRRV